MPPNMPNPVNPIPGNPAQQARSAAPQYLRTVSTLRDESTARPLAFPNPIRGRCVACMRTSRANTVACGMLHAETNRFAISSRIRPHPLVGSAAIRTRAAKEALCKRVCHKMRPRAHRLLPAQLHIALPSPAKPPYVASSRGVRSSSSVQALRLTSCSIAEGPPRSSPLIGRAGDAAQCPRSLSGRLEAGDTGPTRHQCPRPAPDRARARPVTKACCAVLIIVTRALIARKSTREPLPWATVSSPGADVGGVSPAPVQMWQRVSPVPVQMWHAFRGHLAVHWSAH